MPLSPAQRVAAYRARKRDAGAPDTSRTNAKVHKRAHRQKASRNRPFVGCDGEGCGLDELGRQNYMLFRMGDRELFTGDPLKTWEILDFICDQPSGSILVGFAFGYDVTMMLRDLSHAQQKRLFAPKVFGPGFSPFVWYKEFDIEYLPKNYIKIRKVRIIRDGMGGEKREVIKGSTRIIYETFGFFQKSFLKVIKEFGVGLDHLEMIAAQKDARADFLEITPEIRDYCHKECIFLAELMEKLRGYCADAGIIPRTWNGAGKLAKALHALNETIEATAVLEVVPKEVLDMANMAYYGGRFEITRTGAINQKVYEYDIRSAYPAAMPSLPCLQHGTWERADNKALRNSDGLFVAAVTFKCLPAKGGQEYGQLGALPIRSKEGHLYWPLQGAGVYWSHEIKSAEALGFKIKYKSGWKYKCNCDCRPFDWVEPLFDYRRSIGSSGPGYPIKLGINSLYGLLAQRKGVGKYVNMVHAGLITALTRSKINHAVAESVLEQGHGHVMMIATDAVYSLEPLPKIDIGERLGQWEQVELPGLFIVQPGLYWCPQKRKRKSRGLSGKFFEEEGRTEAFEKAWIDFEAADNSKLEYDFPKVTVPVPGFIGLKLAISRNKPETAGTWINDTREISFDYRNKRSGHKWQNGAAVTKPKLGSARTISLPHRDFLKAGGQEPWEAARSMLEDQPDYIDLGIPFKD